MATLRTKIRSSILALTVLGVCAGCSTLTPCPVGTVGSAPPAEKASVLFLIGDAGEPGEGGEPVLEALTRAASEAARLHGAENVAIAFLGDMIYPNGLPTPGEAKRAEMERKLDAQIEVAAKSGVRTYFVPGNHDWWGNKDAGLKRILTLEDYLREDNAGLTELAPSGGCPGPTVIDVGEKIQLVAIDTHWWLRKGEKGKHCTVSTEAAFDQALHDALTEAGGRKSVIAAHHPLISGGPHGGTTLFLRAWGVYPQDIPHKRYQALKNRLEAVFADAPTAIFAAGHEHSLQLHRGPTYTHLVAGGGNVRVLTSVGAVDETVTCEAGTGFARYTVGEDGDAHLSLYSVGPDGMAREIFAGPPPV